MIAKFTGAAAVFSSLGSSDKVAAEKFSIRCKLGAFMGFPVPILRASVMFLFSGAILLIGACSVLQPPPADESSLIYRQGKRIVEDGENLVARGERRIQDGEARVQQGKDMIVEGEGMIAEGREMIQTGQRSIARGKEMMERSGINRDETP